jgi:hypothetical protein
MPGSPDHPDLKRRARKRRYACRQASGLVVLQIEVSIYRSLFVQTRGVLKKELLRHLRSKRSMRRSKPVDPNGDRRGHIKDAVSDRHRG